MRAVAFEPIFANAKQMSLYRGVYRSFSEAVASAPKTKPVGYDNPEPAAMYDDRQSRVYPEDYPVMFWLASILRGERRVLDVGGHVGIAFYAYEPYIQYPNDLAWTVMDVPAVAKRGRELARMRGRSELRFVSDLGEAPPASVLLASGSLQYIDEPLAAMLQRLPERPAHVVINKTPLYDGDPFITLQSIGTAFCPYRIFNRSQFVRSLEALGYERVDTWENHGLGCSVAAHTDKKIRAYSGMYLRLTGRAGA